LSGWRTRSCGILAGIPAALFVGACGGQTRQDASEPSGTFPVEISTASFPTSQRLAQHTQLVISVRNAGSKAIPNVAVTITDPKLGTAVNGFSRQLTQPGLANRSRPVWVVERPPGSCSGVSGYSCQAGGAGGAASAYANTWVLGRLPPGRTATFKWALTAVSTGTYEIHYRVAAGLNGKAKAQLSGGGVPAGTFTVKISGKPSSTYVTGSGQIVTSSRRP
jgi:hypothetical protein